VGFVVDKMALGQIYWEYFGFPYQFIIPIYHPGLVQYANQWLTYQVDSVSHPTPRNYIKKAHFLVVAHRSESCGCVETALFKSAIR
jgi:hypothetical protein